jgi:transposase-like protein
MPRSYPPEVRRQVIELALAGTRVPQLSLTFGMTETTIYNWLKQDRVDRGEMPGLSTEQQLDLASAKRRIRQLESGRTVPIRLARYDGSGWPGRSPTSIRRPVARTERTE